MIRTPATTSARPRLWLILVLLTLALSVRAEAQQDNRLRRIQILPHTGFTRVNLYFQDPPDYLLHLLPGRVRVSVTGADAPSFRKLRAVTDAQLTGVFCTSRDGGLRIDIALKPGDQGVQVLPAVYPSVLSLDIGPSVKRVPQADIAPGREAILNGIEKFVREYRPPTRAGLSFAPTDAERLKTLFSTEDEKLFRLGEVMLYKERGKESLELFAPFIASTRPQAVRALGWYRIAEALCLLDRTAEALKAFQQGEALWPGYLEQAPEIMQTYAETRTKGGDFAGGRALLVRLIDRLTGSAYVATLLNRLADMTERHGDVALALALYRTVAVQAPGTAAAGRAAMKIADHQMFLLSRDRYRDLLRRYQALYEAPGDFAIRDEALFKMALLQALYGPCKEALAATMTYDRLYPHGIFSTIVKKMREDVLLPTYREIFAAHDDAALVKLALEQKEYLARCLSDPDFAQRLAHSFAVQHKLYLEAGLFSYLVERSWAAGSAPFMLVRLVEDNLLLGNLTLADSSGRIFLSRFPADPRAQRVREQLGRIAFESGDLKRVVDELGFLNGKGKKPELPESDYYLGKALVASGGARGAEESLARFVADAPSGSPLVLDGYFALAGARAALKDYQGALASYRLGGKLASGEVADQFLYKTGELYLAMNMVPQATEAWEKVAERGKGGTWGKLAAGALSDLKWRLKNSGQLP